MKKPAVPTRDAPISQVASLLLDAGCSDREAGKMLSCAVIQEALERCQGNVVRAARLLNRHRNTVSRQIEQFGLKKLPASIRHAHKAQLRLPLRKEAAA